MAEQATAAQGPSLSNDLDVALLALDAALTDARKAIEVIRASLPQISGLERQVREMETAMSRALESLSAPLGPSSQAATISQLRAVPAEDAPEPVADTYREPPASAGTNCLRLTVQSGAGSLDLKAVDTAVNENQDVVDVALLDYDGRQATLKLWVAPSSDAAAVRDALLASLKVQLGADGGEASIEFDEAA